MKAIVCQSCGSTDLYEENGYQVCRYCGTRNVTMQDEKISYSEITLSDDVDNLLKKCREDPVGAHNFAKLILEIDPNNAEARSYLKEENSNTSSGGCYVATVVYGSYDCPQVWTLRRFRDDKLSSTWYGRAFIRIYYATSPTLVKYFGNRTWFIGLWKNILDKIVHRIKEAGVSDAPYVDK